MQFTNGILELDDINAATKGHIQDTEEDEHADEKILEAPTGEELAGMLKVVSS